jgi:hypothetical protein
LLISMSLSMSTTYFPSGFTLTNTLVLPMALKSTCGSNGGKARRP